MFHIEVFTSQGGFEDLIVIVEKILLYFKKQSFMSDFIKSLADVQEGS
jgi:hypothetical protein